MRSTIGVEREGLLGRCSSNVGCDRVISRLASSREVEPEVLARAPIVFGATETVGR